MQAAGGRDGVGKLSADLGDFGNRQERGDRNQDRQRQEAGANRTMRDQHGTGGSNGQAAQSGGNFQQRVLARQVGLQLQAQILVFPPPRQEAGTPGVGGLECDQVGQPLDRFG